MAGNISGNGFEQSQEQKLHFLDYWRVIQKRKEAIIAVVIILVLGTALFSLMQEKQYIAKATLQLSPQKKAVDPFQTQMTPVMVDPQQISTVISQITLPNVLERVIKGDIWTDAKKYRCRVHGDLELDEVRIAGTGTICPKPLCNEKLTVKRVKEYPDWQPLTKKWSARYKKEYNEVELIYALARKIKARPVRGTYLIEISFQSEFPKEAAQIATMVAKAYVQFRNEKQEDKLEQAMDILDEEIKSFKYGNPEKDKKGLIDLEDELDALAKELGVSPDENQILSPAINIQDYKRRLSETEVNLVAIEEKLATFDTLTEKEKINVVPQNNVIVDLKRSLVKSKTEKNQLERVYSEEKHPALLSQNKIIAELERMLDDEAEGIIKSFVIQKQELEAQKGKLLKLIASSEKELLEMRDNRTKYNRLDLDVRAKRQVYIQMISEEVRERVASAIPMTDVSLDQEALTPFRHSKPKTTLNIILSLFVGLFVGTGLAYFIEYLDTSVKTLDDIERYLNVPILGVIPQNAHLLTEEDQKSPVSEAYRMLWTNIEFADSENKLRTLLVTSSGVGEGKTTTATNLSIAVAQMGYKVLLIDSDLRRPRIHKLLKESNKRGWTDILMNKAEPKDVMIQSEIEGLFVIPSGKLPHNIVGLLNSQRLREAINRIDDEFDIIIMDSPPIVGVSDASIVASLADGVLLIVEYRKYPKAMATRAKKALEAVGANLIGGVVNNLNVMKEDYYYYSQMYHYHSPEEEELEEVQPDNAADDRTAQQPAETSEQHKDDTTI
jgi:polysaccharide biosynthesis transport protein